MDVTFGKVLDKLAAEGIKERKCLLVFFLEFLNGNITVSFTMPTFISRFNVGLVKLNLKLGCLCLTQLLICFSISIKYQNVFAESLIKYIQALLGNLLTI